MVERAPHSRLRRAGLAVAATIALVAVSGAGGTGGQTPKSGGTIAVTGVIEPACLNPLVATCANAGPGLSNPLEKVLEPAFDIDARFTFRPRLVSGVTVSQRPPFTLTYHIRREARWSDGVPVTAADFVFTHAARLAHASSFPPDVQAPLRHVRRVTAVGPKTVRVTLRERFSGWHALFPNVLPVHVLRGQDLSKIWVDGIDDPKTGKPIGSGPFLVESLEHGKALTLVRNPRYWGPHLARVDRLVLRYDYDAFHAVEPLLKGDLDIVFPVPRSLLAPLLTNPDFRVVSPPGAGYDHLAFRLGRGGARVLPTRWSVGRSPTASTAGRSRGRSLRRARSRASSTSSRAPTSARTGRATARSLLSPARCWSGRDAGEAPTASSPAPGGGSCSTS